MFLHHIRVFYVQLHQNCFAAIEKRNQRNPKVTKKLPIVNICNFEKTVKQIEQKFLVFLIILGPYLCNGKKNFRLGFEKQSTLDKNDQKTTFGRFSFFSKLSLRFEQIFLQPFHTILGSAMAFEKQSQY